MMFLFYTINLIVSVWAPIAYTLTEIAKLNNVDPQE